MSAVMYDNAVALFTRGELDWENAEIRVMLVSGEYQPSQTGHETRRDVAAYEVAPSGTYTRGGNVLPSRSVVRGVANEVRLMADRVQWFRFTGEFRYAVLFNATGDESLVAYADLGHQQATNAKVVLEYDRDAGVAAFTVAPAY